MAKYEVIRPWHGVKRGDVVEIEKLHSALKSNVRLLNGEVAELDPATPAATSQSEDAPKRRGRPPKAAVEETPAA